MSEAIRIEEDGVIATVLIDHPESRNALTKPMWRQLEAAMNMLSKRSELRCVVLRGGGTGGFGAGADIHEFVRERDGFVKAQEYGMVHAQALAAVRDCIHPVIAAIDGPCMGASFVLAAACDFRISSATAKFALPPMKLGATLGYPELRVLLDLIGRGPLMELLLEGQPFDAVRAKEIHFISRFVEDLLFDAEVDTLAQRIAGGAPITQRLHKRFVHRLLNPEPIMPEEFDDGYIAFDSADFKEGYNAFLEKRKAVFQGR